MTNKQKTKKSHKTLFEFIRYNLSGGIQFGWQYLFFFILGPGAAQLTLGETAFTIGSSYVIYFILSKQWVFTDNGKRKTSSELVRFGALMATNLIIKYLCAELAKRPWYRAIHIATCYFTLFDWLELCLDEVLGISTG